MYERNRSISGVREDSSDEEFREMFKIEEVVEELIGKSCIRVE